MCNGFRGIPGTRYSYEGRVNINLLFACSDGEGSRSRYRPRHDVLVRGRVPARQGGDHRQRPGQPHHALLCGVHGHRAPHRRRRQEPGRHEPQ